MDCCKVWSLAIFDESGNKSDSIWAIVAGTVKAYNLPIDYVLYDMSYANMVLYGAVLPSYDVKSKDDKNGGANKKQDAIKVDEAKNYERVKKILDSFD